MIRLPFPLCRTLLGLFLALAGLGLAAGPVTWPPIPAEVWALKSGAKGAVVVDKWVRYGINSTEARVRIRIFGEQGLGAAVMPAFRKAWTLEGRTVQPDGTETPLNSEKDLVDFTLRIGMRKGTAKALVPPGLTADCVVDLHYDIGSMLWGRWVELPVQEAFPISRLVVEMAQYSPWYYNLLCPPEIHRVRTPRGSYEEFTFVQVPALVEEDYALSGLYAARFCCYDKDSAALGPSLPPGADNYWKHFNELLGELAYGKALKSGRRYRDWSAELRAGLTGDREAQAREIHLRLAERIRNMSAMSGADYAALTEKKANVTYEADDLDASVKRGETTAMGMHNLFYQLLVDQGLEPRLLWVANRNQRTFTYALLNPNQFSEILIGVAGADGAMVWFWPQARFFPAGVIHPDYQLTQALQMNLKDKSCKAYAIPPQKAAENGSRYTFDLRLEDEEAFRMEAAFTGYSEYEARRAYCFLAPEEQARTLKEKTEQFKDLTVTRAAVDHATDYRHGLSLVVEGTRSFGEGRRRTFPPFPGLEYPVPLPGSWPARRTFPIVLPSCRQVTAVSRFKLPEGWKLGEETDFVRENPFGKVTWQVRPQPGAEPAYEVTYTLAVNTMYAEPAAYLALRELLGWMETASLRTLTLERP